MGNPTKRKGIEQVKSVKYIRGKYPEMVARTDAAEAAERMMAEKATAAKLAAEKAAAAAAEAEKAVAEAAQTAARIARGEPLVSAAVWILVWQSTRWHVGI